jgi:hypothetical protein
MPQGFLLPKLLNSGNFVKTTTPGRLGAAGIIALLLLLFF